MKRGTILILMGIFVNCYMLWNFSGDKTGMIWAGLFGGAMIIAGAIQNISSNLIEDIKIEKLNLIRFIGEVFGKIGESLDQIKDSDDEESENADSYEE